MLKVKKYWNYLLLADVISFFVTRKCQKYKRLMKIDENSYYWQRKSASLAWIEEFQRILQERYGF